MITDLVDKYLNGYEVPGRDKYFIKEAAHTLAFCLRASPKFNNFQDNHIALFAVGKLYAAARNDSGVRIQKPSTVLKGNISKTDMNTLEEIRKKYKESGISLWSSGSLKSNNLIIRITNQNMTIYCGDDNKDDECTRKNLEQFPFI